MRPRPRLLGLALALACGPGEPLEPADTDASTSASTSSATTSTTTSTTTTSPTTGEGTSTTTEGASEPPPVGDDEFCPLDWAAVTTISGVTPTGPFTGTHAWFSWEICNLLFPYVYVVEDPAFIADRLEDKAKIPRAVNFAVLGGEWEYTAPVGTFELWAFETVDGKTAHDASGTEQVTLTMSVSVVDTVEPAGVPRLVGELSIESNDGRWDLTGSFDAAYCGRLSGWFPAHCE